MECGSHGEKPFLRSKGDKSGQMEVIVLADQSFPPLLACEGDKRCVKICRLEHASLDELVTERLDIAKNREVTRGTMVLLGSLSHMKRVGTVANCEDLRAAAKKISVAHGGKVTMCPAPTLFSAGATCAEAIRTAAEVNWWALKTLCGEDWFPTNSFRLVETFLSTDNVAKQQEDFSIMLRLPTSLSNDGTATWRSVGWNDLIKEVTPLSAVKEKEIVLSLLKELRVKQALHLYMMPSFERGIRKPKAARKKVDFILIGSSNANRTSVALMSMGYSVTSVHCANWCATSSSVVSP
jgi:hypothetical protein